MGEPLPTDQSYVTLTESPSTSEVFTLQVSCDVVVAFDGVMEVTVTVGAVFPTTEVAELIVLPEVVPSPAVTEQ